MIRRAMYFLILIGYMSSVPVAGAWNKECQARAIGRNEDIALEQWRDEELLADLLKQGTCPNLENREGLTLLMLTTRQGLHGSMRNLIASGADVDKKNRQGMTALSMAVLKEDPIAVQILLEADANPNERSMNGKEEGILVTASKIGNTQIIHSLIQHGADVNAATGSGLTPLIAAIVVTWPETPFLSLNRNDTVRLLVDSGSDVNVTTEEGLSVLDLAERSGNSELVNYLRAKGAIKGRTGDITFTEAAGVGNYDLVAKYLKEGINPDVRDLIGRTALIRASASGHLKISETLIQHRARVNIRCEGTQRDALMFAAIGGYSEIAEMLIKAGADVNGREFSGKTVVMLAAQRNHASFIQLLWEHGADLRARVEEGVYKDALDIAMSNKYLETVDILQRLLNK